MAPVLIERTSLGITEAQLGLAGSAYLLGPCGALVFGRLTDLFGRKRLFFVTLFVYLIATALTALSWNF